MLERALGRVGRAASSAIFLSCSFCPLEGSAISPCMLSCWKGSSLSMKEATSLCAEERECTAWGRGGEGGGRGGDTLLGVYTV